MLPEAGPRTRSSAGLECPQGHASPGDSRFCAVCGLPLVLAGAAPPELDERRERARKVSPQFGEGALVKVGWARNQAEAELLSGMLLEEGVPSVVRRSGGFDVPDFLAAGPRDILVAASGADVARDVLRPVGVDPGPDAPRPRRAPVRRALWVRLLAAVLVAVLVGIVVAGLVNAFAA